MKSLYDGVFDGTANTEFIDDRANCCEWCLPTLVGTAALAYAIGWVSAIWLMLP